MSGDNEQFAKLLVRLTDQASKAIMRVLKDKSSPHPLQLGTIEIFLALQSCRSGVAPTLLKELTTKGYRLTDPRIDKSEYDDYAEPLLTSRAKRVLEKACSYAKQQGEYYAGTDHLLLALIEVPETAFSSISEYYEMDKIGTREHLTRFLRLGTDLKPRTRAYEFCTRIECGLKEALIHRLKLEYGDEERSWWVRGVPEPIRMKCAATREEEGCILDVDAYLYLISFKDIIKAEENWRFLGSAMEAVTKKKGKKHALAWVKAINDIRNAVMHPSKREIQEEDLDELANAYNLVQSFCARIAADSDV